MNVDAALPDVNAALTEATSRRLVGSTVLRSGCQLHAEAERAGDGRITALHDDDALTLTLSRRERRIGLPHSVLARHLNLIGRHPAFRTRLHFVLEVVPAVGTMAPGPPSLGQPADLVVRPESNCRTPKEKQREELRHQPAKADARSSSNAHPNRRRTHPCQRSEPERHHNLANDNKQQQPTGRGSQANELDAAVNE